MFTKILLNRIKIYSLISIIFMLTAYNINSQPCYNKIPGIIPNFRGYVGVQTDNPQEPLNIHGDTLCMRVVERFSYNNVLMPQYQSYLSLTTLPTLNAFTQVPSHGLGDFVISSMAEREGGNIIITTRDTTKKIILATSDGTPASEFERVKVFPEGQTEFNTGGYYTGWKFGTPKITIGADGAFPALKLYHPTGTSIQEYGDSYPWWISVWGNTLDPLQYNGGALLFKWGQYTNIGQEQVSTKVIFKAINQNGDVNVGINTGDYPKAMLHGTQGSVLFDGDVGDVPEWNAGTRFMWVPLYKSIRAGGVSTGADHWNYWGNYSTSFGLDNEANSDYSTSFGHSNMAWNTAATAFGEYNEASGANSTAIGLSNAASGNQSLSLGTECQSKQSYSTAIGTSCTSDGIYSTVIGNGANVSDGGYSTAIGQTSTAKGDYSFVIGNNSYAGFDRNN